MVSDTLGTRGFSRAGHYKDLTETGNRARKVSGTQGRFRKNCIELPQVMKMQNDMR